jgi:hypothetical protein
MRVVRVGDFYGDIPEEIRLNPNEPSTYHHDPLLQWLPTIPTA